MTAKPRKQCNRCGVLGCHSPFCTYLGKRNRVAEVALCGQGFLMTHADGSQSLQRPDGIWVNVTHYKQLGHNYACQDLPDLW